jgi:hypothetical protein
METLEMWDNAVYPIGIKIDPLKLLHWLILQTWVQHKKLIGFKILEKQRNKQISCCKKECRNVNKYKKDEEEYIYPSL